MKRAFFVSLVVGFAFAIGCNSRAPDQQQSKAPPGFPAGSQPVASAPEEAITKLETSEERATYLGQLAADSGFDPKSHVPMLKKYAGDSDEKVAKKAKELLARAQ